MRLLLPVLICIVLLSARTSPERARIPALAADAVTIKEVRRGMEFGAAGDSPDAFLVERPVGAREGATSSVFVVEGDGALLRRVEVEYGHASPPMIQVVRGVQPGDRIIVSDMRAWDAFERLQLRWR